MKLSRLVINKRSVGGASRDIGGVACILPGTSSQ
jgi:hypothetical protein